MSIDQLQSHYGFTRAPFGRGLPPQALHPHPGHRQAVARIQWVRLFWRDVRQRLEGPRRRNGFRGLGVVLGRGGS